MTSSPRLLYRAVRSRLKRIPRALRTLTLRLLDRFKLNDLDRIYTEQMFVERTLDGPWRDEIEHVCAVIWSQLKPASVADIGCGPGVYLASFKALGVPHILGIEGSANALRLAVVSEIVQHDLREPFTPPRRYDLVLCVEVAEHLHKKYARRLVETVAELCEPRGSVVFTASPPGHDGVHHVNLQAREFWIELFRERGFEHSNVVLDAVRERLTLKRIPWVKRNLMIFRRPEIGGADGPPAMPGR
ncbi:MAG TPA: class I SAM-dependent methyltransferase [Candidatus Acidoferrum sp.]|nr:class I SAM-dependent methyltransferase [Candidatus Acidoferrum sp.]